MLDAIFSGHPPSRISLDAPVLPTSPPNMRTTNSEIKAQPGESWSTPGKKPESCPKAGMETPWQKLSKWEELTGSLYGQLGASMSSQSRLAWMETGVPYGSKGTAQQLGANLRAMRGSQGPMISSGGCSTGSCGLTTSKPESITPTMKETIDTPKTLGVPSFGFMLSLSRLCWGTRALFMSALLIGLGYLFFIVIAVLCAIGLFTHLTS